MRNDANDRGAVQEGLGTSALPEHARQVVKDRAWGDLLGDVWDALQIRPPAYGLSVFGLPHSWVPTRYSEYGLLYSWQVARAWKYLADVSVPSLPVTAPAWFPEPLAPFFWHPSRVDQHPDQYESWTSHPHEAWLFVNGILTNDAVAQLNAAYLADLFHRPITMLQNSTDGLLEDLVECAREKSFGRTAEAAEKAFPPIYDALKDPEKRRVVVVAHSQGTIIAAVVLRLLALIYQPGRRPRAAARAPHAAREAAADVGLDPTNFEPLDRDELAKLELYCFANCATQMRYLDQTPNGPLPWIESYGNEFDIVARLGMLAPHPEQRDVAIDGPRYKRKGAWGHLLNQHYLRAIDQTQREEHRPGPTDKSGAPYVLVNRRDYPSARQPRLYRYLNGGAPLPAREAAAGAAHDGRRTRGTDGTPTRVADPARR